MKKLKFILSVALLALAVVAGATAYAFDGSKKGNNIHAPEQFAERQAQMGQMKTQMPQADQAIKNNDYQAWAALMKDAPMAQKINADNFSQFVKMHQLMDEARAISEELGLEQGMPGNGFRRGDHQRPENMPDQLNNAPDSEN